MKNKKNIILILCILSLIIVNFFSIDINAAENDIPKGTLRCPSGSNGKCVEKKDASGVVTEASVTENKDGFQITKIVSKKPNSLSKFDVKFIVRGENISTYQVPKDAYIVVIFDKSYSLTSVSKAYNNAKTATKEFMEKFQDQHLALVVFANGTDGHTSFADGNKYSSKFFKSDIGTRSRIDKAFQVANKIFNKFESDSKEKYDKSNKFVVVFGDGKYWNGNDTCRAGNVDKVWNCTKKDSKGKVIPKNGNLYFEYQLDLLKKRPNMNIYTILYKSNSTSKDDKNNDKTWMTEKFFGKGVDYTGKFFDNRNDNNYKAAFDAIAELIRGEQGKNPETITALLTDRLGDEFSTYTGKTKQLSIPTVTNAGYTTDSFEIEIDNEAETGWHSTNNGFDLTFKLEDGSEKKISLGQVYQPEVYWKKEDVNFPACTSEVTINKINESVYNYFSKTCEQGYDLLDGFKANIVTNNLEDGKKSFNLNYGMGFPVAISLSNNVRCTYDFDYDRYKDDLKELNDEISTITDEREKQLKISYRDDVEKSLEIYQKTVENDVNDYAKKFIDNVGVFSVKYDDSTIDNLNFINDLTSIVKDIKCDTLLESNGIAIKNVCTIHVSKNEYLPQSCISIVNGESESCDNANTLVGGNKYFVNLKENHGYVSIDLSGMDYFETTIKLEGDKTDNIDGKNVFRCEFNVSNLDKIIFRQIDVSDPFIQSNLFNTINKRTIGRNFVNPNYKYNFVNIIDPNIWNIEHQYQYQYQLSKTNIENIKRDTLGDTEKVNSYLGTDCKINENNNQYECNFTRNKTDTEVDRKDFFSKVSIP